MRISDLYHLQRTEGSHRLESQRAPLGPRPTLPRSLSLSPHLLLIHSPASSLPSERREKQGAQKRTGEGEERKRSAVKAMNDGWRLSRGTGEVEGGPTDLSGARGTDRCPHYPLPPLLTPPVRPTNPTTYLPNHRGPPSFPRPLIGYVNHPDPHTTATRRSAALLGAGEGRRWRDRRESRCDLRLCPSGIHQTVFTTPLIRIHHKQQRSFPTVFYSLPGKQGSSLKGNLSQRVLRFVSFYDEGRPTI